MLGDRTFPGPNDPLARPVPGLFLLRHNDALARVPSGSIMRCTVSMSTDDTNSAQQWRERAAQMRLLAVKMAGSEAGILINDLAVHYDELADQAARKETGRKGKSRPNGDGR